jgi:polysaccharide export outer membrane protein
MSSIPGGRISGQIKRQLQGRGLPDLVLAAVFFILLCAWSVERAAAQTTPAYQIAAGDKIGVTVIGQPDLSGEGTVDQIGNLRLPIVGDIRAVNLTPSELEKSIAGSLEKGYVRNPVVSVKIAEYRPIYVLGMVRAPGSYPYREGLSVLGAIARAGGIGATEVQQSSILSELLLAEERVRLLEINRASLLTKRARLIALQNSADKIDFPDVTGSVIDATRMAQIRDSEQRAFDSERTAEKQELEALQKQLPRLDAEIASLKQQAMLETQQRDLNHQLVADYEALLKTGLGRKPTYIETKREEARIDGNIERLRSDALRADLAVTEVQFKITELHNTYQRRVMSELRDTDRALLDLTVQLPSAQRARTARAQQVGMLTAEQAQQPTITVVSTKGSTVVKLDTAVDAMLQPGDVVQVGSLFAPTLPMPLDELGVVHDKKAEAPGQPNKTSETAASQGAAPASTVN